MYVTFVTRHTEILTSRHLRILDAGNVIVIYHKYPVVQISLSEVFLGNILYIFFKSMTHKFLNQGTMFA